MYIIKLILTTAVFFLLIGNKVFAQNDISTEHFLEIYLNVSSKSYVNHKIKVTNNDKYNGIKSLDFSEIGENFEFIKNFNTEVFEITTLNNKPTISLNQVLIGPKSVEIGYKYSTDKIFYKNGLNYIFKLIKLNDPYMTEFNLKIFLPNNVVQYTPETLIEYLKTDSVKGKYLDLKQKDIKLLGNEIIFGKNAAYLLSVKHLISKEKPYIIIPSNLEKRQITKVYSISKKPSGVYKKFSNVFFEFEKINTTEFIEAIYYIEVFQNKIMSKDVEQFGLNLTSKQKYWNYSANNIQKEIKKIQSESQKTNYAKKAFENTLSKFEYNKSNEIFSFINRIGAENVNNTNNKNAYCLDYSDYLISLLRGLEIESGEIDGFFYKNDLNDFNVPKLHPWVLYKDSENSYKEVDPTFQDTSETNYFDSFDLSHIALTLKLQNPETPYILGTYTKGNMYESLKIKALNESEILNLKFSNLYYGDLFFAKILYNNSGTIFYNLLPFETKIINNNDFRKMQDSIKIEGKVKMENKNLFYFLPKNSYIYFFPLIPLGILAMWRATLYIKKRKNKGKRVRSVI